MTGTSGATLPATPSRPVDRPLILLTATVLVGALAALLDTTIVAVVLDDLRREFDAPVASIQWVTTAYVLAMTAVIPVTGWAVARYGARATWITATAVFLAGSVLCAAAWSAGSLIGFRILQGLGGGMILPLTQIVLARAAGPDRLGRVLGVSGLVGQLAPVTGPILGGLLTASWGWRWIFLVNIPLCVTTLAMAWRRFPEDADRQRRPLDYTGLVLLPTGLVALLHGLASYDGGIPGPHTWLGLAVSVPLLTFFVIRSLRRTGRPRLLDPGLFARRPFRSATVMMFVLGVTTWGPMFLLPLYFRQELGLDAFDAGLLLAPQSAGLALAYLCAGRATERGSPRALAVTGMALATVATIPFAFAPSGFLPIAGALFLRGVGFAIATLPMSVALYTSLEHDTIPDATALSNVVQRVGAAMGTALMAVLLGAGAAEGTGADVTPAAGFGTAFVWMLGLTAVGIAAAARLPRHR